MPPAPITPPVPVAPPAPPEPAPIVAPLKSGWKTTEAWLTMLVLGALASAGQELINVLPQILATPGMPPWIAPLAPMALIGLGWVMKRVLVAYTNSRVALKLGADPAVEAAQQAGKEAAAGPVDKLLGLLNK